MPDHVHWVFSLGTRLTLSQVVAKWKVMTRQHMELAGAEWQTNYFEHRLREGDDLEAYAFYVFMNPYVAGLASHGEVWPWWRRGVAFQFRFEELLTNGGTPQPDWLNLPAATGTGLAGVMD